eukprot:TRINITY_DN30728_c0_g1_i1.p2 TRINITY_DN30728_c0_g1~~TRINITY_DN30728_c0_g1_i1.p2  ORF type:complete len:114 (+),score=38.94 TRINITY_DN30728_c0_g1_i1:181-522(+)
MVWVQAKDTEELHKEAETKDSLVLIYFTAPWSVPCQKHGAGLRDLVENTPGVKLVSVDATSEPFIEMIQAANIIHLPTIHMVNKGSFVQPGGEFKGLSSDKLKQLRAKIQSLQ